MTRPVAIASDPFAERHWHDVECGSYDADLRLWERLSAAHPGPALELGCGTGRVALHLARRGFQLTAIDADPELVAELRRRARAQGVDIGTRAADARSFSLGSRFGLVLAPMQLVQLLGGARGRLAMLRAVRGHLVPGGAFAAAIVEGAPAAAVATGAPATPDVRERDGWVLSSLPIGISADADGLAIHRRRELVSPAGELLEHGHVLRLDVIDAGALEREAEGAGFRALARHEVPATDDHVASTVVCLEAV